MKIEAVEFYHEPYGYRVGYVKIQIKEDPKLYYLYVIAKDRETGDLKAFPPSERIQDRYIPCFSIPESAKKQMETIAKNFAQSKL